MSLRPIPLAFHLTFRCYGTWLPGDKRGSVNRHHNKYKMPYVQASAGLEKQSQKALLYQPYRLTKASRKAVLDALVTICQHRHWKLYAAHVRSNHIHIVLASSLEPNNMLRIIKAYCTRALNKIDNDHRQKRWSRHGSTQYLWRASDVNNAIRYVVSEQGDIMELYKADWCE